MTIERFKKYEEKFEEEYGKPNESVITVSGLTGVGTSTIAKILESKFNLDRYNAGDFFRSEAKKRGIDIYDFMENLDEIGSEEGRDFDIECDKFLLELPFKKGEIIIESRLSGVLLKDIAEIRIWVSCPPKIVAERISKREEKNYEQVLKDVKRRNRADRERYRKKYGIRVKDSKYYNIIIDNSKEIGAVKENLIKKIENKESKIGRN